MVADNSRPMAYEGIKVTWLSSGIGLGISHYNVQWVLASNNGLTYTSEPISHFDSQSSYEYKITKFIHGECFDISVIATDLNGNTAISMPFTFATGKCMTIFIKSFV